MPRPAAALVLAACLFASACGGGWWFDLTGGSSSGRGDGLPDIVFLSNSPPGALAPEEAAAWAWLQTRDDLDPEPQLVQFVDLPSAAVSADAVLWWHYAAEEALPSIAVRPESLRAVQSHLRGGGSLLLSLIAASYTVPLELESAPPDTVSRRAPFLLSGAEVGGFQTRQHPLAARFWSGVLPSANVGYQLPAAVAYTGDRWPLEGRTWAVHRDENGVDAATKIGVEYVDVYGTGAAVVTIGAHSYFADDGNHNRAQLEQLFVDALRYLDGQPAAAPPGADLGSAANAAEAAADGAVDNTYWEATTSTFVEVEITPTTPPPLADAEITLNLVAGSRSGIEITRHEDPSPFTLSTPRALLQGSQLGRIDEFRVHPHTLLSDLRFGIVRRDRGVTWIDSGAGARSFTARPEGDELYYNDGELEVWLDLAVDRRYPALVGLIRVRSPAPIEFIAAWRAHAGDGVPNASPGIGWDDGAQAVVWSGAGDVRAKGGFGRETAVHLLGFHSDIHLQEGGLTTATEGAAAGAGLDEAPPVDRQLANIALQVHIEPGVPAVLPLVIVAGTPGEVDVDRAFAELVAAPGRVWADNATYFRAFLGDETTGLLVPGALEDAFKWAKVGVETLRVSIPGAGSGLASGFAAPGNGEDPKSTLGGSGALWAVMAADAYGDRTTAATTLRTMARFQGVDGRIPDAITAPGRVIENGARATALYLVALDNHLRTWGDRQLLEDLWPSAQGAVAYLFAADRNDDGLVGAVSRGDRWSDDRAVQTPIDLAALWAAALQGAQSMAVLMGDDGLAARSADAAERVRAILNDPFWDPNERRFNFAKRADGSFVPVSTVLPAVPMMFDLLDPGIANAALDAFSSAAFSRDWGVGLIGAVAETSPGAAEVADAPPTPAPVGLPSRAADVVSPAFTGWTALAEYANQRPEAGFAHTATNLLLLPYGNPGYAGNAFDGTGFTPRPGSAHDATAQAMTLLPVMWGTLGIRPDAFNRSISIRPQLPAGWSPLEWNRINVTRVRVGDTEFRLQIRWSAAQTQFRVDNWSGARDIELRFTALVPSDLAITLDPNTSGFEIIGTESAEDATGGASTIAVRPTADAEESILAFNHDEYPRLWPPPQLAARAAQASGGLRIIRTRYLGGAMTIEAEGLPGQSYTLSLATPWNVSQVTGVPGVGFRHPEEGIATISVTIPGSGARYRPIDLEVTFDR